VAARVYSGKGSVSCSACGTGDAVEALPTFLGGTAGAGWRSGDGGSSASGTSQESCEASGLVASDLAVAALGLERVELRVDIPLVALRSTSGRPLNASAADVFSRFPSASSMLAAVNTVPALADGGGVALDARKSGWIFSSLGLVVRRREVRCETDSASEVCEWVCRNGSESVESGITGGEKCRLGMDSIDTLECSGDRGDVGGE
jgi:hypothetical protein